MVDISYYSSNETLIERLLKVRGLEPNNVQDFLNPNFKNSWHSPWLLTDMDKAVERVLYAIKHNQKIMIFGDYDADGVTSSYVLYDFFKHYLHYNDISVQLPHRIEDGYGIKTYHLDQMKDKGVQLVITVDNGITAVQEAVYAANIGLDLLITDHHQPLDEYPKAHAVVNPQISPNYPFKGLCGVAVVFKLIIALAEKIPCDELTKTQIYHRYMPVVAIGTVSDCVPLLSENRLFVKRGLEIINKRHSDVPLGLQGFLEHFNLYRKPIESVDIGFMIGPRLNAAGRMLSAYEAFYALWYSGEKQKEYLERLADLNNERKELQDEIIKKADQEISHGDKILIIADETFHEGLVGIVAGRLTEKYHKPSVVLKIDLEKNIAVASLRAPAYFSIIDMLYHVAPLLERFGGHKQAGGLTVSLDKLDELMQEMRNYAHNLITDDLLEKKVKVDTIIAHHELHYDNFQLIDNLAPFGEGNREPVLLLQGALIKHKQTMGKNGKSHLKLYTQCDDKIVEVIQWNGGERINEFELNNPYDMVVSHRWDGNRRYLTM